MPRSEAADVGFGLGAVELVGRLLRRLALAEESAVLALNLGEAHESLSSFIAVIRQDRRDDVDRARTFIEGYACVAIHLHAGENIVGPGACRIVVEALSNRRPGRKAKSYGHSQPRLHVTGSGRRLISRPACFSKPR